MRPFWCFTVDINSSLSSFDTISATGASENAQDTTWVTLFNPNITGKHKIWKCHWNCLRFSFKPESHKKKFEKRQNVVPGYKRVRVSFLTILKEASDSCEELCNCSISSATERENLFWRQDGLLPLHPVVFKFDNWREVKGTDLQNCRTLFRRRESKSMHFTAILSFISASTALFCKETKIQTRKVLIKTQ